MEASRALRRPIRFGGALSLFVLILGFGGPMANAPAAAQNAPDWVARSNEHAQLLLGVHARFAPEFAGQLGVPGLDERVLDLLPDLYERQRSALEEVLAEYRKRLSEERHPAVRQDLEILIQQVEQSLEESRLEREILIPYFDLDRTLFLGLNSLLDDQIPEDRRAKALVRLRKYAGLEDGYEPLTELAMARTRERLEVPGLLGPAKTEVERNLAQREALVAGIEELFRKYGIDGYEEAHRALREQLSEYESFVRREILPRGRDDFRLPPELYAFRLEQFGVDMPVDELTGRAKTSFREIQNEMQAIAALVARERGWEDADYRAVLRTLKEEQLVGEEILSHYRQRIRDLEALIERESVVTLPQREMRIRLASEAETASVPAPHMRPPRLIGNTGEMGTFVLPLNLPSEDGEKLSYDDFTFAAASWTLTVHEGRPGHELQFAALVEKGVSIARAVYAFNSVNVEGWALYAEAEMKPYLPLEGQLVSLQHRLMRAARAFLDPGLQLGEITAEEATRVLTQDVVVSAAMTRQEVERYTFRMPGQATSYFCGYERLMALRTDVERTLGERFDRRSFHDFVLAQGLLPPHLLRRAVLEELVPQLRAAR